MKNTSDSLIVIPARYKSSRLLGKPLMMLGNKTMLQHVCDIALQAASDFENVNVLVATDDAKIFEHANSLGVTAMMTPPECACGTDRIIAAIAKLPNKPGAIINLQGDSPLTPVSIISTLLEKLQDCADNTVLTPIKQLTWQQLDQLRQNKLSNPYSGTTVTTSADTALWFSKQIIPAIRNESSLRAENSLSPVYQHLGIYGYTYTALQIFAGLPKGTYEELEGLEQLRFLEHGYKITTVPVELENLDAWRGVDTLDDAKYVTQLIEQSINSKN